ncbi:MAG TPA: hypothetical protein VMU54_21595 [Planctomycetota bacterium]|nr:hypothetical protein [Planctomycetota bacterium]
MIKTNPEKLVDLAVCGTSVPPGACDSGGRAASDEGSFGPLRYSRIDSSVKVGDSVFESAGALEGSFDQVRLGDPVAIADIDSTRGPRWQPGAPPGAVVGHGASRQSGHGPGVNPVWSSPKATVEPIITRKANLAELLGLQ